MIGEEQFDFWGFLFEMMHRADVYEYEIAE